MTKADDVNDGTCDTDCSLREAITAANASAHGDVINFDDDYTIMLGSVLPAITQDLRIDGETNSIVSRWRQRLRGGGYLRQCRSDESNHPKRQEK